MIVANLDHKGRWMRLQQSTSSLRECLDRYTKSIQARESESKLDVRSNGYHPSSTQTIDMAAQSESQTANITQTDLNEAQVALMHSQKMESLGALATGMAHEINTPLQYIGGNLEFMQQAFEEITQTMALCMNLLEEQGIDTESIQRRKNGLDFVMSRLPNAISKSLDGVDQVSRIVQAMRGFSHLSGEWLEMDINDCIDSVLTMSQSEWKYCADVNFDPQSNLPKVSCHPGQMNQAFLNVMLNAVQAVEQKCEQQAVEKGEISIRTFQEDNNVCVEISDTGAGIPKNIENRIFDQFFTTKEIGKGTGQGLAICRSILVDEHGGKIDVESSQGEGATFTVYLPLVNRAA